MNVKCELDEFFNFNFNEYEKILYLLRNNTLLDIYFKFNWENYRSFIIVQGNNRNLNDNKRLLIIQTPQIPLIGGCWSNFVAYKCLNGQLGISFMLDCIYNLVNYLKNDFKKEVEVRKHDKCFYAPFLYTTYKNEKKYFPLLINNYPDSYKFLIHMSEEQNYWKDYHDII